MASMTRNVHKNTHTHTNTLTLTSVNSTSCVVYENKESQIRAKECRTSRLPRENLVSQRHCLPCLTCTKHYSHSGSTILTFRNYHRDAHRIHELLPAALSGPQNSVIKRQPTAAVLELRKPALHSGRSAQADWYRAAFGRLLGPQRVPPSSAEIPPSTAMPVAAGMR